MKKFRKHKKISGFALLFLSHMIYDTEKKHFSVNLTMTVSNFE